MDTNAEKKKRCLICDIRTEILKSVLYFIREKDKELSVELANYIIRGSVAKNEKFERTFHLNECEMALFELYNISKFLYEDSAMFPGGVYSFTDKKIAYQEDTSNPYDGIPFIL